MGGGDQRGPVQTKESVSIPELVFLHCYLLRDRNMEKKEKENKIPPGLSSDGRAR